MLAGLQHHASDPRVARPQRRRGGALGRRRGGGAPRGLARLRKLVHEAVRVDPRDAVAAPNHQLQLLVGNLGGTAKLRVPPGCPQIGVDQPRGRREAGQRLVRGGVRRHALGVDRDFEATPLKLSCGGQPNRAAADHRRSAIRVLERHLGDQRPGAPTKRVAGAAVAIVVDHRLGVEPFGSKIEAGGAVRSQPDGGPDDPVPRGLDERQVGVRIPRPGSHGAAGTATGDDPDGCQAARLQQDSSVHLRLRAARHTRRPNIRFARTDRPDQLSSPSADTRSVSAVSSHGWRSK